MIGIHKHLVHIQTAPMYAHSPVALRAHAHSPVALRAHAHSFVDLAHASENCIGRYDHEGYDEYGYNRNEESRDHNYRYD